ncbi:unnamed protein product [Caenorhabditis auriculariae]|uniref:Uncharacterized protein n=1 Tax=Caenorhabditis auriculariae TaxID=2777116 RepID=A0A8S1GZV8_9PELO|nr:unnamed protein product [Caenorhabditis auriculariae]
MLQTFLLAFFFIARVRSLEGKNTIINEKFSTSTVKLLSPSLDEKILHLLLDSAQNEYDQRGNTSRIDHLITVCKEGELPYPFPKFLCPFVDVYLKYAHNTFDSDKTLYDNMTSAVAAINDVKNHPCNHSKHQSGVVVFIPQRIVVGCVDLLNQKTMKDDFMVEFLIDHPFPTAKTCEEDSSPCELEVGFVDGYMLYENRTCCCPAEECALLLYDQPELTVAPLVFELIIIDPMMWYHVKKRSIDDSTGIRRKRHFQDDMRSNTTPDHNSVVVAISFCVLFCLLMGILSFYHALNDDFTQEAMSYGIETLDVS